MISHLEDAGGDYLARHLSWWELTTFFLFESLFHRSFFFLSEATSRTPIHHFNRTFQSFNFWEALNDFKITQLQAESYLNGLLVGYLSLWNSPVEKNQYPSHNMLMLNKYQRRSVPGIKAVNLFALQHIKKGLLLSSAVCQEREEENPVWLVTKGPQLTSRASGFDVLIITLSLEVIIKKHCSWTSSTDYWGN